MATFFLHGMFVPWKIQIWKIAPFFLMEKCRIFISEKLPSPTSALHAFFSTTMRVEKVSLGGKTIAFFRQAIPAPVGQFQASILYIRAQTGWPLIGWQLLIGPGKGETSAFFRQATCSTKSTSSASSATASSLYIHTLQPFPFSNNHGLTGQHLWQIAWAGQQQLHERNQHLPALSPNNTFWSLHLLWLGCSFWTLPCCISSSQSLRFFPKQNQVPSLWKSLPAGLFMLASRSFWLVRGATASETLLPTKAMLAWLRKAKSKTEPDISSNAKSLIAFSGKALLPSLPSARPFLWKTLLQRQSGFLHPLQAAKQVFDPHSCQGAIFHVSACPEHIFPDCSAFVCCCVQSNLGHARDSGHEGLPFFLLVGMFSFHHPHSQEFSVPFPNFFFTAQEIWFMSFWASCLSQVSWCTATVALLAATAALLAASTLFFLEVINTEDMLGQKLQEYH